MSSRNYRPERTEASLSSAIVRHLQAEGKTLAQIGKMMGGLSHAFVSQVRGGKKSLTMARLEMLEKELGRPLPVLLLQAVDRSPRPAELEESYKHLRKMLDDAE